MDKPVYQFQDFFTSVNDEYKDFVVKVNEILLKEGCKATVGSTKTNPFSVKYKQGRRGIFNFVLRNKSFKASVYASNYAKYSDVLDRLPESMVKQIAKSSDCKNMISPATCWEGCSGYKIHINEDEYQKCSYGCFQFDIDDESMPFLIELLESELKERRAA